MAALDSSEAATEVAKFLGDAFFEEPVEKIYVS